MMMGLLNTPAAAPKAGGITAESIQAKLHLQPQQTAQLQKIVLAGMKVMFDKASHQMMLDQLQGEGEISQKLGEGIAGLMALLMQESKNSLPGELLIPAGLILCAKAGEFLRGSGEDVSDQDLAEAMSVMIEAILGAVGTDTEKLMARAGGKPLAAPDAAPANQAAQAPQGAMQ